MLKFYNTLSRKKEIFQPQDSKNVKIYICGPTVYNFIHIGNARPMCVFDTLRRYLEFSGYVVNVVQNFTDIDDKIIKKANEEKTDYLSVSKKYIKEYRKDAEGLNIKEANVQPKATENVDEMILMISELIKKGFGYFAQNGDVYFDIQKFNDYGKLSNQKLNSLLKDVRISANNFKKNSLDFTLWKSSKPGEPSWPSPWGEGRPGWHIECSAMAKKYFGSTVDIHCGGQDLIFPHHENEIAQSEASNCKEFAKIWLHNGYINVNNQKMSKSLNNFFTVREIAEKYSYNAIRYLMISSHYRSPINFSDDIIKQCCNTLKRLQNCKENLEFLIKNSEINQKNINLNLTEFKNRFIAEMNDDLNTAGAIGVLFDFVKEINSTVNNKMNKKNLEEILILFNLFIDILGITWGNSNVETLEIEKLLNLREEARKSKNWKLSDEIRELLKLKNVVLEDTKNGVKWHFEYIKS